MGHLQLEWGESSILAFRRRLAKVTLPLGHQAAAVVSQSFQADTRNLVERMLSSPVLWAIQAPWDETFMQRDR
ncbi:hypothetical protein DKQ62_06540 [Halomonas elongata]|nr:hypothetical protein DKQ62_06540 [Halomonas elongata]